MVNAIAGHSMFSFIDDFNGNNQVIMHLCDAKKTTFRTPMAFSHYIVVSFGLENVEATYQRAMTIIFHDIFHD